MLTDIPFAISMQQINFYQFSLVSLIRNKILKWSLEVAAYSLSEVNVIHAHGLQFLANSV
jgi:hypothetical protein